MADDPLTPLLDDPAVWIDAPASLEDDVAAAVRAWALANPRAPRSLPRRRAALSASAAIAAVILAVVFAATIAARRDASRVDFAARLTGTNLAPAARASAAITKQRGGFTVILEAHGLDRLPPGEFYQAWLQNDAGTLVPIGTFSSSDSRITLWSGVSPKDFSTMTVTIEQSGLTQSSSGRRVLTGTVHEP